MVLRPLWTSSDLLINAQQNIFLDRWHLKRCEHLFNLCYSKNDAEKTQTISQHNKNHTEQDT